MTPPKIARRKQKTLAAILLNKTGQEVDPHWFNSLTRMQMSRLIEQLTIRVEGQRNADLANRNVA